MLNPANGKKTMYAIAHLTSAHPRYDVRIFWKECCSLAAAGFTVHLIVADGKGHEIKNGVNIHDVGILQGRIKRMVHTTNKIFVEARQLDVDIYHLHDPELMPIGMKLKKLGKRVVFDAHEDLPKQLLGKPYLNPLLLELLSMTLAKYEKITCKNFNAIVAATPFIRDKFLKINSSSIDINNFPLQQELVSGTTSGWHNKKNSVCYIGAINQVRGIKEVIAAMGLVASDTRLKLAGNFNEFSIKASVKGYAGWQRVDELGLIGRKEVRELLADSFAGIVTFHPLPNHIDAQPNKMFEYMSAGIPVIASDFPLWRQIVEENHCGMCVDPLDPQAIAQAIDYLATHSEEAQKMGENGQRAITEYYNWTIEEKKLVNFYDNLCMEISR